MSDVAPSVVGSAMALFFGVLLVVGGLHGRRHDYRRGLEVGAALKRNRGNSLGRHHLRLARSPEGTDLDREEGESCQLALWLNTLSCPRPTFSSTSSTVVPAAEFAPQPEPAHYRVDRPGPPNSFRNRNVY